MIVVSNRVKVPEERIETFHERLRTSHGIEAHPGFRGLKLLVPVDADGHITMTFWDSLANYKAWIDSAAFDRAHDESSAEQAFRGHNDVEIHEVLIEREPFDN